MSDRPTAAELAAAAEKRGIVIAPVALPAVLAGGRWLKDCVALLRSAELVR